jgi:hypothetical protein
MNRAWIPAAALAGVSVAGLIALGPLTDSMGTKVSFPTSVAIVQTSASHNALPVAIRVNRGVSGQTSTTGADRGGPASTVITTGSDTGFAGFRKTKPPAKTPPKTATPAKSKPKKTAKPTSQSIGTSGETGPDSGFAGGSSGGTQGHGEQAATPSSDGN